MMIQKVKFREVTALKPDTVANQSGTKVTRVNTDHIEYDDD